MLWKSVNMLLFISCSYQGIAQCTSGDCQNGFGSMTMDDGASYTGQFKDGKRHGFGTLRIASGAMYVGEFINEQMWGIGVIYGNDGKYLQSGLYNDNKKVVDWPEQVVRALVVARANMREVPATNKCVEGDCQNGFGVRVDSDGNSYGGNFRNGLYQGWGHLKVKGGAEYIGFFENDAMSGTGIVYGNSGEMLRSGTWANNALITTLPETEVLQKVTPTNDYLTYTPAPQQAEVNTLKSTPPSESKNLNARIKEYVDKQLSEWEVKGEFEKSDAYLARVNAKTKSEQAEKFRAEAIQNIGKESVNWREPAAKYDADKELFTVTFANKYPVYVKVPLDKAKSFADNIRNIDFRNPSFIVSQNELVLTSVEAINYEDYYKGFNTLKEAIAYIIRTKAENEKDKAVANATDYKNKIALVIGNSSYQNAPLKNPMNDAIAFSNELRALGFEVLNYNNVSRKTFREAIHEFGDKLRENKGIGLFYYAGHGLQSEGVNYLVPVDAIIEKDYDIQDECIRADFVLRMMETNANPMNIIILDACRNNPFTRSSRSVGQGLAQPERAPSGSIIAFATAPGKTASDGDTSNGLYTQELIKAMKKPGLSIEQIFKEVRINVAKLSNDQQVPWENSSLMGDFYFRKN
jgi:hypothetical protein